MNIPSPFSVKNMAVLTVGGFMLACVIHPSPPQIHPVSKVTPDKQTVESTNPNDAPEFNSAAHRHQLLTNFTKYALVYSGNRFGYVPTNSVAIREFALELLLRLANEVNSKWNLGIPSPITSDQVTRLDVLPKTNEIGAGIELNRRHAFAVAHGRFERYADLDYWINAYENNPEKFRERAKLPDRLSKAKALKIAKDALHALSLTEEQLKISNQPKVEQWFDAIEKGKRSVPFHHYEIRWKRGFRGEPESSAPIFMEVSGITGTVVAFENSCENSPRIPLPTNYWRMLGMQPPVRPD